MNDDYLWNKTGDDPEVRALEEALAVFRDETRSTPFPAAAEAPAGKNFWVPAWLKIVFAAPAAAALALGFWFWDVQQRDVAGVPAHYQETGDRVERKEDARTAASEPQVAPVLSASNPSPIKTESRRTARTRPANAPKPAQTPASGSSRPRHPQPLTREEEYAYKRLMLALSITGEKLKIVRDTIDGTDDDHQKSSDRR